MLHCELLYPYTLLHFSLVAFTRGRTDHRTRQTTANPSRVIYVYFVHIVVGKLVSKFIVKYTWQAHMFTQKAGHNIIDEKNSSYNTYMYT